MKLRNLSLIAGVLLAGIFSGNFVQSSGNGRSAKDLEDPTIPQIQYTKIKSAFQPAASNRGMQENNMMLYRSVFTISLKLLTLFLIIKLISSSVSGGGHGPAMMGWAQPGMDGQGQGGAGGGGYQQTQLQQLSGVNVNYNPANSYVTATSTGAAAGASTGGAAGVVGLSNAGALPVSGGYQIAAAGNNPRPSFLLPRFRFGFGPRHPPYRQPPPHMMRPVVAHHNMGGETHLVETHSNLYVLPDGSQARVPISAATSLVQNNAVTPSTSNTASKQTEKTEAKSAASEVAAESTKVENVVVSTSSSTSTQQAAERRSSLAYKEKLSQLQQAYEDWNLHFNPGTRSI